MQLYKTIFDNNNKEIVTDFFQDNRVIRRIWDQVILPNLTFDVCFEKTDGPNPEIELTYREISRVMTEEFKLSMPDWWMKRFPATPFKLSKKWFFEQEGTEEQEEEFQVDQDHSIVSEMSMIPEIETGPFSNL